MEIEKKEAADMNDAPPSDPKNCLYNCSECSSNIEIISLDENNIEFICNNKHNIKIEIKEYLNKMKQYNKIKLNDDKCDVHKKEYLSYCFDCNNHLCKDCLKTGNHKYHYKINIIEILPEDEILDKIIKDEDNHLYYHSYDYEFNNIILNDKYDLFNNLKKYVIMTKNEIWENMKKFIKNQISKFNNYIYYN